MSTITLAHSFLRKAARLKIIMFNSGRFFAALNNTYKSAGTLVLLLHIPTALITNLYIRINVILA